MIVTAKTRRETLKISQFIQSSVFLTVFAGWTLLLFCRVLPSSLTAIRTGSGLGEAPPPPSVLMMKTTAQGVFDKNKIKGADNCPKGGGGTVNAQPGPPEAGQK